MYARIQHEIKENKAFRPDLEDSKNYILTVKFPKADERIKHGANEGIELKNQKEEIIPHSRPYVSIHLITGAMSFIGAPLKSFSPFL